MSHSIVIIDNNQNMSDSLTEIFMLEGYKTSVATDSVQGLRLIQSTLPDVIIYDWVMLHLDGGELYHTLKASRDTANIPFIVITGYPPSDLNFEPAAVIMKPIDVEILLGVVQNTL